MKRKKTADALKILHRYFYDGQPARLASLERERINAKIARDILTIRSKCGLTQKQLAKLVKTTPSVISRLESADYDGHSLSMLQRIAAALNQRVEVRFLPLKSKAKLSLHLRESRV